MAAGQSAAQALLSALPRCAAACAEEFVVTSTCAPTNLTCICTDAPLLARITQCTTANCTVIEALSAANVTDAACGVTPTDSSQTYIIVTSIFLAIAVLFYLMRLYVRPPFTPGFRIDDGIMLVATIAVVVFTAINLQAAHLGLGKDIWNVPPDNIDIVLKDFYIGEYLYFFIIVLTKLAVLAFYLKVFPQPYFQKAVYLVIGLCICYFVSFMFVLGFECQPLPFFWEQWRDPSAGTCININAGGWAAAAINIILDVSILTMPVPVILKLQISRQQKLQVLSMFGVGSFITVVSIIRLQSLISFAKDSNLTYHLLSISIWSSIELYISIVCACMPATRLFLQRCWPSRFGTSSKSHQGSYVRQSSTSFQPQPHPPGPQHHAVAGPGWPMHNSNNNNHIVKSIDVSVSQAGREGDEMELIDSDGWRGASQRGNQYVSSTGERRP
ncbi:hypothetical protein PV05_06926 [Exophiala xenobiotica]|uniref:CFEM domain-containing protein n=1 Tax=Exophiala xenobiotica TaxID=348802 RepID=A0A0D2EIW7_9EURO|nr:uncharacterized protein PV05_06926 [Exophiala xenobiotica]KIW54575.1 hypothetical protein PV05_06926 [Exophiala xenobiotica]